MRLKESLRRVIGRISLENNNEQELGFRLHWDRKANEWLGEINL